MFDVEKWLKIFDYKNVENFFKSEKDKGGIGEGIGRMLVGFMIYQIPVTILNILVMLVVGVGVGSMAAFAGLGILGAIIGFVVGLIVALLFFLITNGTQHVIAGVLGGKGSYGSFLHLSSFISAASYLVALVFGVLSIAVELVPILGLIMCVLLPVIFLWILYMIYVSYLSIKVNYALSSGRAAAAFILNIILWVVIFMVLAILLYAILIVPLIGMMGSSSMGGLPPASPF
jgi:hypothetical protein